MGGGAGGPARARGRPHRLRQDPGRVPLGARPAGRRAAAAEPKHRCRVLYVSPLKALAVDVQRNLRSPLTGIRQAAQRLGPAGPGRSRWACAPATPRPTSGACSPAPRRTCWSPRRSRCSCCSPRRPGSRCAGSRTVIVDEVHAVAGTKRGAHLALSLERLDELLERAGPADRAVGHRAAAGRGLHVPGRRPAGGGRAAAHREDDRGRPSRCRCRTSRALDERPAPGRSDEEVIGSAAGTAQRPSIWPAVERRLLELVRAAPLDDRVLELPAAGRAADGPAERAGRRGGGGGRSRLDRRPDAFPAEAVGQSGIGGGAPPVVAKAHHGSMSREQRTLVEEELKAGLLPCVVATSSLELGIDMGAVDLVVQVEAPPSVASGLQRVGRAGHQVGAVSARRGLPQVPRRPRVVRGGRRADGGGRDRVDALPAQPARRAGPAGRGDGRAGAVVARRPGRGRAAGRAVRGAARLRAARGAGHARRALPVGGVRRAAARGSPGTGSPTSCAAVRARSGWRSPPAAPSRTAACSRSPPRAGPTAAGRGSASWTRRWSTSRGSATRSCSAPPAGGSRTSRTTA